MSVLLTACPGDTRKNMRLPFIIRFGDLYFAPTRSCTRFRLYLGFRVVMRLGFCVPSVACSRLIDNLPPCFSKLLGPYGFQDLRFRQVSDLHWCTLSFHREVSDVILLVEGELRRPAGVDRSSAVHSPYRKAL